MERLRCRELLDMSQACGLPYMEAKDASTFTRTLRAQSEPWVPPDASKSKKPLDLPSSEDIQRRLGVNVS